MVMSRFFCIKMQNKCWPSGPSSCCGRSLEYTFSKTTQNLLGSLWNMSSAFHMFPFQIHGDVRKYKVASPRKGRRSPGEIPFPTWLKFALFHKKSWVLNGCGAVDCCFNAHYTLLLQRERVVHRCIASWWGLIFTPCLIFLWQNQNTSGGELCALPVKVSLLNFVLPCCILPTELEPLMTSDTSSTYLGCLTFLFISCRHRLLAVLGGSGWESIGVREEDEINHKVCLLVTFTRLYYLVQDHVIKILEDV